MKILKNKLLHILFGSLGVLTTNVYSQVSSIKVVDFPSGIRMKVLKDGDGKRPDEDSHVLVNYRGVLPTGYEFVSTYRIGKPAEININKVIICWKTILPYLKPGSLVHLYCPASTAYGEIGVDDLVPANSVLLFELELVKVLEKKAVEKDKDEKSKEEVKEDLVVKEKDKNITEDTKKSVKEKEE